jgi:hypothetical protein
MTGTAIEGWDGSSPILAAPRFQASPSETRVNLHERKFDKNSVFG